MQDFHSLIGTQIEFEVSGRPNPVKGILVDFGSDILVIYNGQFLYLPIIHMQSMKISLNSNSEITETPEAPFENQIEKISYRKILMNAKGIFVELYVTGDQSIHGYITSIMNDYFIFHTPVYRTLIVHLHHLKYLIPYNVNVTPYSLTQESFPFKPADMTLARTFEQQLKKVEGKFIVLDLGRDDNRIGLLKKMENNMIELITANGRSVYIHLDHIKTVHQP
ncbi:DUF2642 domain-containing protein [Ferviditalea candida]|uniref:DUF2642 domain-containing protein n=1 Tax=Ferviditalea candida TaxID=3108399 RepID=A0ABU5ZC51_9BACL|nr:DUF2642 domain-containing protein [Paenibacillaceae bacterium T2]